MSSCINVRRSSGTSRYFVSEALASNCPSARRSIHPNDSSKRKATCKWPRLAPSSLPSFSAVRGPASRAVNTPPLRQASITGTATKPCAHRFNTSRIGDDVLSLEHASRTHWGVRFVARNDTSSLETRWAIDVPTPPLCYKAMPLCISNLRIIPRTLKRRERVEENGFPTLLVRFHSFRYLGTFKVPLRVADDARGVSRLVRISLG